MSRNPEKVSASGIIILILVLLNVIILKSAFINNAQIYWGLVISLPLLLLAIFDALKKKHVTRSEFQKLKSPPALWMLRVRTLLRKNKVSDGNNIETQSISQSALRHSKKPQE